ncbi:hypothetical protein M434DRAFT_226083 [Hypoxylon sp. CO27-5]|nr:hypothetical protein M434DRAFT_226083 [Hypoxylon sp. CO27-5]
MSETPTLELIPLSDQEVELPLYDDGAEVKSLGALLGTVKQTGYSIIFQSLHEVNGSMDKNAADNATLLVIKISPRTGTNSYFKNLSMALKVKPAPHSPRNSKLPEIDGFEPGQQGAVFIKESNINRTELSEVQANVSAHGAGANLGIAAKKSTSDEKQLRSLHTVKAEPSWNSADQIDKVTWKISPADKADGIGDYIVVAMVVKRTKGCQFIIEVENKANVGILSKAANVFRGATKVSLGPFGAQRKDERDYAIPTGVDEKNLATALQSSTVNELAFVHVPEKVEARSMYSEAVTPVPSQRLASTQATVESFQAKEMQETKSVVLAVESSSSVQASQKTQPAPILTTTPKTKTGEVDSTMNTQQDPGAPPPSQDNAESSGFNDLPKPIGSSLERHHFTKANLTISGPKTAVRYESNIPFGASSSRAERHRKMAALYHRLSQLHREEAEEAEGWDEAQYADEAEMQEVQ